jgi:hypothetical protein
MTWMLSKGTLEDGSSIIVLIDGAYRSRRLRGHRDTLLALHFPGTYMMDAQERRDAVLANMDAFLSAHDGVHVGGVTRVGESYTFLFYLGKAAERGDVPLPAECADSARIWFARDSVWMEYEDYLPTRPGILRRVNAWWNSIKGWSRAKAVPTSSQTSAGDDDEAVLHALAAAGSDLTKPTDIVFYLHVPTREDANRCYVALWNLGYRARASAPLGRLPDGTNESRWSVVSHFDAVPTLTALRKSREIMNELARECGGEYDGWEAAVA